MRKPPLLNKKQRPKLIEGGHCSPSCQNFFDHFPKLLKKYAKISRMKYEKEYGVIVVGAGHAGVEAALAVARMGVPTLLLTISLNNIARMSCNPAIGGPGKSQIVREIDALGGEIAKATDATYLQLKMLNLSKGPAVHSLRAQSDIAEYINYMSKVLENQPLLDLKQGLVNELIMDGNKFLGVKTQEGFDYYGQALVLTTGTFLRGKIYTGMIETPAGRAGEPPAEKLTGSLNKHGIRTGRLKTGTPARIDAKTVDFSKMQKEPGMKKKEYFSFSTKEVKRKQVPCYLTYTNEETHQIILNNLDCSPLYGGMIDGVGPRYCPSIEDKVVRFRDKKQHQLFVEPEGAQTNELYLQGMNTSLPYDVQLKMIRSIKGLENAEIMRPGYAIAYDFIYPEQLNRSLALKDYQGLYSAGQINGTSGYEEAAGQGIVAGINAALFVQKNEPLVLTREESYIGTLIDDLITKEIREPYRMMTSRSEYRLYLRQDNADERLLEKGYAVGLVKEERYRQFKECQQRIKREQKHLKEQLLSPTKKVVELLHKEGESLNKPCSFFDFLKRHAVKYDFLEKLGYKKAEELSELEKEKLEIEVKYLEYIKKVKLQIARAAEQEQTSLQGLDYSKIKGLRNEAREKLKKIAPATIGQASRIAGVNPADIAILLVYLKATKK